jgi:hypothetical protein
VGNQCVEIAVGKSKAIREGQELDTYMHVCIYDGPCLPSGLNINTKG